jgi:MFS family permease
MAGGSLERARGALAHDDFRRLFGMRLLSQGADGLMQAALVASLAFSPERQTTAAGFAIATAVVIVPYSLVGPFAGVFIDRWRRKRIMVVAPLLRALPVFLLLADPSRDPVPYYAAALWITATNRFFLATAQAVVPRLVPTEDLLGANSIATVGGTVALLAGAFAGGLVADAFGLIWVVGVAAVMWLATSAVAASIRSDLRPLTLPESDDLLRHQLRRVGVEFADGIRILAGTPRAVGPIVTIGVDQVGQGLLLVIALVVFRERFGEGVGSFSWLLGAGGVGVFLGLATIGSLDERFDRSRIVAGAFVVGGVALLVTALVVTRWSVLVTSFAVGLTFAWKKVPIDTMVQEAVPDGVRGRVFSVYDVAYNVARLLAAFLAVVSLPTLGLAGSVAAIGGLFLLWAPALPAWLARAPEIRLRFAEGGRAEEWPLAVRWGGVEEPVEVLRSGLDERPGGRFRTFRLSLADGSVLDVAAREPDGPWEIERERIEG